MKFFEAIRKAILSDRLPDLIKLIENQISEEIIVKNEEPKKKEKQWVLFYNAYLAYLIDLFVGIFTLDWSQLKK